MAPSLRRSAAAAALLVAAVATLLAPAAAAGPITEWSCGELCDGYGNCRTECATSSCSPQQRNFGGDVIVLDTDSYGDNLRQGFQKSIPSTCCKKCQDTDGCNAWSWCGNKDGCGSGCSEYVKQFKVPVAYEAQLPHKMFGNFKGCVGDKWPANMCTLKKVADPAKPPIVSSKPQDGWVSGTVARASADARCPAGLSAESCRTCLGTKDSGKCLQCVAAAKKLTGASLCSTCANIADAAARDSCYKCAALPDTSNACSACFKADFEPGKPYKVESVGECFACVSKIGGPLGARAESCGRCYESWNVDLADRGSCVSCVTGSAEAAAAGCSGCLAKGGHNRTNCLGCVKQAKSAADGMACGKCNAEQVPKLFVNDCQSCALKAPDATAKGLCANLDAPASISIASLAAVKAYHGCLTSIAKDADGANACWQCYQLKDGASEGKCFACMRRVSSRNAISCSHCWGKSIEVSKSATCETCLLGKDSAKQEGQSCWMGM